MKKKNEKVFMIIFYMLFQYPQNKHFLVNQ